MRILWLKTELLHPVDKGGRIRTYQMLKHIVREHHVTYLTLDDGTADPNAVKLAGEYSSEVVRIPFSPPPKGSALFFGALAANMFSQLPYAVARYHSREMQAAVARLSPVHDIVVCDFLVPAVNMPEELSTPTLLFQHNVEAMIWERHANVAQSFVRKRYMAEQWRRMVAFEQRMCRSFDHVVAVSPQDAEAMRAEYGVSAVSDIPTGVDTEYFTPANREQRDSFNLVFTGSMDWMPNDDAMLWFVGDILPLVRKQVPQASVTIVGRTPGRRLVDLVGAMPGVVVTGRVEDVRPYLEKGSVFIVPIRIGGGTRLKIFEAMAMGLPVVSTTVGAEGLPVTDGENALLRDHPGEFANAIVSLLRDEAFRRSIAMNGQLLVRKEFGWEGVAASFLATCESVAAPELIHK